MGRVAREDLSLFGRGERNLSVARGDRYCTMVSVDTLVLGSRTAHAVLGNKFTMLSPDDGGGGIMDGPADGGPSV